MVFIPSGVVVLLSSRFRMARDPLGTGTLMAFEVSFPESAGRALATAFPAPVSVITILRAAARPLRYFEWILSTRFWSFV